MTNFYIISLIKHDVVVVVDDDVGLWMGKDDEGGGKARRGVKKGGEEG